MSGQPHFELYRDRRGEWRWRFRAGNGKIIAVSSEGYVHRYDADRGMLLMADADERTPIEEIK